MPTLFVRLGTVEYLFYVQFLDAFKNVDNYYVQNVAIYLHLFVIDVNLDIGNYKYFYHPGWL